MDIAAALQQMDAWSLEDRIRFMEAAWDRLLDKGYDPTLTDEQRTELDRRLSVHEASPAQTVPWEKVRDNLQRTQ